jgi:uncharacterized protein (DUF58 family)
MLADSFVFPSRYSLWMTLFSIVLGVICLAAILSIGQPRSVSSSRRRRVRPLEYTPLGMVHTGLTILVGFLAINLRPGGLLSARPGMCGVIAELVLVGLLGLIVASGILSELTLREIRVAWRPLPVRDEGIIGGELELRAGRFPAYCIDVGMGEPACNSRGLLAVLQEDPHTMTYQWPAKGGPDAVLRPRSVSTSFPFGLFRKTRFLLDEKD